LAQVAGFMVERVDGLEKFAGVTGVGSLCLLGTFLVLDSIAPTLFPTVELYSKTSTWSVVVAVPVFSIAYLLGALAASAGETVVRGLAGPPLLEEFADLTRIVTSDAEKSPLVQRYLHLQQQRSVLAGGAVGLLSLVPGALAEIRNLPDLTEAIAAAAAGTTILACLAFWSAGAKGRQAHVLVSPPTKSAN
jgi:hypothetical protein